MCVTVRQHAGNHFQHRLAADRAVARQRFGLHPEQLLLGSVAVGDKAALEPAGTACPIGTDLGQPATGTGLSGGQKLVTAG